MKIPNLRHHPTQHRLKTSKARFKIVVAGRGSGKTTISKMHLILSPWSLGEQADGAKFFYGAPTRTQAKQVAWYDFLQWIPDEWIAEINRTELAINYINGATLQVVGLHEARRIEGRQYHGCVIDESSDIQPGVFSRSVLPALQHHRGWCWRIGVPKRQGCGAAEFRQAFEEAGDTPDTEAFWWPSKDIVPPETIEWAKTNLDPKDYNEQFEAKWETAGGAIFYAFNADNVAEIAYDRAKPLIVGSDFNVDPMCWLICQERDGRLCVIDEIFERNTNTRATLDRLWDRYGTHSGPWWFYGDAAGRQRKTSADTTDYLFIRNDERFAKTGKKVLYPKANPTIAQRFAECNAMLRNSRGDIRLLIDPKCKRLIGDMEQRSYKQGTSEPDDYGDVGHMSDALGYIIHMRYPIKSMSSGGSVRVRGSNV